MFVMTSLPDRQDEVLMQSWDVWSVAVRI